MIEQWREASGSEKHQDRIYPGGSCLWRFIQHHLRYDTDPLSTEITPDMPSRSPSPRHTSRSRSRKVRPRPQDDAPLPSSQSQTTYPQLRKKPSITMPGSLFPRSDSLQPDSVPSTPQSNLDVDAQDLEPGPSNSQHETPADQSGPSPWRSRPIASVHDAVQRFTASGGEERDFSLLVVTSPGPVDLESPGTVLETSHSPPGGVSRKGKERAVDDGNDDLAFILDHRRVQDKEKQLDAVRRETGEKCNTTGDGERNRDKERIRMLEEEVRMLKEEVCCITPLISLYFSFWYLLTFSIIALPPPPFATSPNTSPNTTPTSTTSSSPRRPHPPPSSSKRKQGPFCKCARCLTPN